MSKRHYIIPVFVPHEGCPNDCVFCNQKKISGVRETCDLTPVEAMIQTYLDDILPRNPECVEIAFFGGSFTGIELQRQKDYLGIAKKFKDLGYVNDIRLSTRPDYINFEILEHLKAFGVTIIELGVQSLSDIVLEKSARGHDRAAVVEAVERIRQYDFKLGIQIMIGLPGDTPDTLNETVAAVVGLAPDFTRIYPTLVVKETELEQMYLSGAYSPLTLEEAVELSYRAFDTLMSENIQVIRVGLQPTDDISEGAEIVAGPFHPSFRQLVEGKWYYHRLERFLQELTNRGEDLKQVVFRVHPKDVSNLVGLKKTNKLGLAEKFGIKDFKVFADNGLELDVIQVTVNDKVYYI